VSREGVLASILAAKEREVQALVASPLPPTRPGTGALAPRGHVLTALARGGGEPLRLIAEHKRRSPSAGNLSTTLSPGERASRYAASGAAMVSVLCDGAFFGGAWEHVTEAREAIGSLGLSTPVLAKEFVLHERQLDEAAWRGADAVLLVVRIVSPERLAALLGGAGERGLAALVEVTSLEELSVARSAGATLIGVNARDLDTLAMDAGRAAAVLAAIPAGCVPVYLSGIRSPEDVARVAASRAHAALIGEVLMRDDDPGPRLRELVAAALPRS